MIRSRLSCSWSKKLRWFTSMTLTIVLTMMPIPPVYAQSVVKGILANASEVTQRARSRLNSVRFARSPRSPQGGGANRGMPAEPPRSASDSPRRPDTKMEREARVARLETNLRKDVELQSGERMQLAAVPLDIDGNAIHGLAADWESDNPQVVSISNKGEAVAGIPGKAQITASAGSKQAQVKFTVTPPTANTAKAGGNKAVDKVSGAKKSPHNGSVIRTSKGSEQKSSGRFRQYAHRGELTGSSMPQGGGRDPNSLHVARNAVGNPPNKTTPGAKTRAAATEGTETPGSSNFNFSAGVVSLPGRGLDINLSAFYNSRIWNRVDSTEMNYDQDQGWPAPGFRLGYGKLTWNGTITRSWELVDPDGTRHQMLDPNVSPQPPSYTYDSADGTFIHLTATAGSLPGWPTPTAATYPDGTQVLFGAPNSLTLTYYPTQIIDRQGNTVLISYLNGEGPRISSIQDTLLRHIYFKYVGNDLVAITAPGLTGQADLPVIRFYYSTPDIPVNQTGLFQSGITVNAPATAHVISYIYLPSSVETNDAHIGYRYYYSAYGMIYQIAQFRGMTISTAANDYTQAGTVSSEGIQAALTTYNYQGTPVNPTTGLADAPYYTTRTDEWAGRVSAQPVYTFVVDPASGVSTVTAPDNPDPALRTATETHTIVDSGQWDDGLISETKIKVGSTVLSDTFYTWDPGPSGFNARLKQVKTTNEANQTRATVFTYDTADLYNNVWKISERDLTTDGSVSPTELRRTETTYQTGSQYTSRGLIHLPATVKVFKPGASTPASQTDYSYDDDGRVNLTAPSDVGAMYTNPQNSARGDLTTVTQYADAANPNGPASPISHSTNYDSMGNVTLAYVDCCQQKTFSYSSGYFYAYPTSVTSGTGPTVTTTATYDLPTGLVVTVYDENNQPTTTAYFIDSLRPEHTDFADGGAVYYHYNDNLFTDAAGRQHYFVNTSTRLDASRIVDSYRFFDGRGAVTQTFDNWTNANGWSTQDIEYDVMERPYHSGNPYYCGGYGWVGINPTGLWTTKTFDNLGRVTRVDMPSGDAQNPTTANVQSSYAGTVTTVTDQAGKQRRQVIDALGRVVRLDEPGANGNLDANGVPVQSTAYEYDILNNLIHVTQGAQQRYFKYDSLSRLTYERQVEQDAPWTTTDSVAGNNQWSRKIIYNSQSLVQDAYDARQINTHFVYDGLNRVSQINYNLQSGSPDPATPSAYYWYDSQSLPNGAPVYNHGSANGRLIAMTYGGVTATTGNYFGYDQMGRVNIHRQVTGATTYGMSYGYNVGGLLTSETYNSGRVINYAYDEGGRLSGVTDGLGATYDSGYTYAPHGGLSSETFGNSAVHSMTYNNALQASEIKLKQSANGAELQRYNYSYGQVNQADGSVNTAKNNGQIGRIDGFINGGPTKEWDQRFTYDELGRLSIAAEFQQGDNNNKMWQFKYTYDRWGNRFQSSNSSENYGVPFTPVVSTDIISSTNRFTSGVTYDNGNPGAGNITSDSKFRGLSYAYDANNRQLSATGTGVSQTSVYDCAGQRVQTTANGVTRTIVYDIFGQDIADYLGASGSTLEREYIYRSGQLLATTTSFYLGISNAGFETPALGTGGYQYGPTGASWTFAGGSGVSNNGSGFTWANPNAPEGNQVAFLQGGSPAAISQSISGFEAGVTYTLTFSAAQRAGCCGGGGQDFQVYLDNTLLGTFHPSGTSYADYSTGTFTTTAGAHVLKFAGLNSSGGDNTAFIDKVRIGYAAPSVVSAGNAGFETPALGAGGYQYGPTGAAWTFAGGSGVSNNGSGFTYANPNAPEGNQVAFLQGGSPAAISQSISGFQAGVTYTLTFSAAQRPCCATSQDFQVYLDNTLLGTFHPSGTSYADYSTTFTTTAGAHVLKFAGLNSNGGDNTAFLDNVRLTGAGASTGETNYVLQDAQGSTRAMMNNNAVSGTSTIIARHDYLPFGEEIGANVGLRTDGQGYSTNPWAKDRVRQRYGLTERDDVTGLDHTWWRKYESFSGRWTSPDPARASMNVQNPQSFNRFSYVNNDPANFVDPTGLLCLFVQKMAWVNDKEVYTVDVYLCNDGGGGGGGGGGQDGRGGPIGGQAQRRRNQPQRQCSVQPLSQITDPGALRFEAAGGNLVDTANLTQETRDAMHCLEHAVTSAGGTFTPHSAYRPPAYQRHLREVWDKWQQLRHNHQPECQETRRAVEAEKNMHHITEQPAGENGPHTRGIAFDATVSLPARLPQGVTFGTMLQTCNVTQPRPGESGGHHFEHR